MADVESVVAFPPLARHSKREAERMCAASQAESDRLWQAEEDARLKAIEDARIRFEKLQKEREERKKQEKAHFEAQLRARELYSGYIKKRNTELFVSEPFDEHAWLDAISDFDFQIEWSKIARQYNLNTSFFLYFDHCGHWVQPVNGSPQDKFCISESRKDENVGRCDVHTERGCPYCARTMRQSRTPVVDGVDGRQHSLQSTMLALGEKVRDNWENRRSRGFLAAYRAMLYCLYKQKLSLGFYHFNAYTSKQKTQAQILAEINAELSKFSKREAVAADYYWPGGH